MEWPVIKNSAIAFILFFNLALTSCSEVKQTQCMPVIVVYPTWSADQLPLKNIPWHKFTHITLTFLLPNADGSLNTQDVDKIIDPLITLAHQKNKKVFVSIADIFAGYWYGEQYLPEIQQHLDYAVLMAYDFTGAWESSPVTHHADYDTFKKSINFVLDRGFQKEKLLVGFPSYGIEFVDEKNKQVNKGYPHKIIVEKIKQQKGDLNSGKIDNVFFETPELVKKKSHYIIDQQLAGIFMFELTQDTLDDKTSLMSASNQVISPSFCQ